MVSVNRLLALCAVSAALAACQSAPAKIDTLDPNFAYLQNRYERQGGSGFAYIFEYVDGKALSQGFWSLNFHGPRDMIHKIESGKRVLGIQINYFPWAPDFPYADQKETHHRVILRDRGGVVEERKGITINAEAGHVYQVACKIEFGRAYVWIEERTDAGPGAAVSNELLGLAEWGRHGQHWFVHWNLPDTKP